MASHLFYIVASSPRTGSYLLCEGLEATGIAGKPTEVFSPEFQHIWRRRWSLSEGCCFEEYLRAAVRYGTTLNGVYGLKIHWMHVPRLARDAGFTGESAGVLQHLFPDAKFVHIMRGDRRAQALSYFRALATNEWWRIDGVHNDQTHGGEPSFDAGAVMALEAELERHECAWQEYFRHSHSEPLTVRYETLVSNYRGEVARVLEFLGLDPAVARLIPPPRLVRQSDGVTERWRNLMNATLSRGGAGR